MGYRDSNSGCHARPRAFTYQAMSPALSWFKKTKIKSNLKHILVYGCFACMRVWARWRLCQWRLETSALLKLEWRWMDESTCECWEPKTSLFQEQQVLSITTTPLQLCLACLCCNWSIALEEADLGVGGPSSMEGFKQQHHKITTTANSDTFGQKVASRSTWLQSQNSAEGQS